METFCSFCDSYSSRIFALNHRASDALNKSLAKSGSRHSCVSFCKRLATEAKQPDFGGFKNLLTASAVQVKHASETSFADFSYHNFTEKEGSSFWKRLKVAWRVLFPPAKKVLSSSDVAKRRLKMILISDRCAVNGEAKRKIVNNIVDAMSEYVEIRSAENVQLNVSAAPNLGAVCCVSVPIRRVKAQFQEFARDLPATDGEYDQD